MKKIRNFQIQKNAVHSTSTFLPLATFDSTRFTNVNCESTLNNLLGQFSQLYYTEVSLTNLCPSVGLSDSRAIVIIHIALIFNVME